MLGCSGFCFDFEVFVVRGFSGVCCLELVGWCGFDNFVGCVCVNAFGFGV